MTVAGCDIGQLLGVLGLETLKKTGDKKLMNDPIIPKNEISIAHPSLSVSNSIFFLALLLLFTSMTFLSGCQILKWKNVFFPTINIG